MKKLLLAIIMFFGFSISALAGQFGPIEPTTQPNQFSVGAGYFFQDTKWEDIKLFDENLGKFHTKSNQIYLQGAWGPTEGWEIYGRLGMADAKLKNDTTLEDSSKPFGTIGLKGVLFKKGYFSFGPFIQGTYFSEYKDKLTEDVGGIPVTLQFKLKNYSNLTLGPEAQMTFNKISIYTGGFYSYSQARVESSLSALGVTIEDHDKISNKNPIGGFLGIMVPVTKKLYFNAEGQISGRPSGGITISYSF